MRFALPGLIALAALTPMSARAMDGLEVLSAAGPIFRLEAGPELGQNANALPYSRVFGRLQGVLPFISQDELTTSAGFRSGAVAEIGLGWRTAEFGEGGLPEPANEDEALLRPLSLPFLIDLGVMVPTQVFSSDRFVLNLFLGPKISAGGSSMWQELFRVELDLGARAAVDLGKAQLMFELRSVPFQYGSVDRIDWSGTALVLVGNFSFGARGLYAPMRTRGYYAPEFGAFAVVGWTLSLEDS